MTRFLRAIYVIVFLFFILAFHFAGAQSTNPGIETLSSDSDMDERFYLYTENYGRYNYSLNGRDFEHWRDQIGGSSTDLVKAIFEEADIDYRMRLRTWSVGYRRVLGRPNHGIFSTARTEQREDLFHWLGPIANYNWIIFGYEGTRLTINSLEDLRTLRVGGFRDSATTLYLEQQGIDVSALPNDNLNPRRLANNQIDVWIASDVNAYDIAEASGFPDIVPLLTVRTVDMYLAINRNSDPAMLERLDAAYRLVYNANNGTTTAGP